MLPNGARPGGAHAFLWLPLHALNDQVVAADALLGSALDELHERLCAASREASREFMARCGADGESLVL